MHNQVKICKFTLKEGALRRTIPDTKVESSRLTYHCMWQGYATCGTIKVNHVKHWLRIWPFNTIILAFNHHFAALYFQAVSPHRHNVVILNPFGY